VAILGSGVVVRKIICIAIVLALGISIYAFAISGTLISSTLVGAASGLGAAGLAILLSRLGVGEWIDGMITSGAAAKEAEYARLMDLAYQEMADTPEPTFGNMWAKFVSMAGTAFSGLTGLVLTPDVIQPIAQCVIREYGVTPEMYSWLSSVTPGYEITSDNLTVGGTAQWIRDVTGISSWVTVGRATSSKINYMLSYDTSFYHFRLRSGLTNWKEFSGVTGEGFYIASNYNVYYWSDSAIVDYVLNYCNEYSRGYVCVGWGGSQVNWGTFWQDDEKVECARQYLLSFVQGIRLSTAWKLAGVPYYVKKVVAQLHNVNQSDVTNALVPETIPYAQSDAGLVPSSITSESDMIARATNIVNNIENFSEYFVDSPRTLEDVRLNPSGTFEINQALGTIKYDDGVPIEWWVGGVKWADITNGYVVYGGESVGYVADGRIYIYQDENVGDPDAIYTIGDSLIFTQRGTDVLMGGKVIGTRSGSSVTLFGQSYTADDTGIMVGGVKLLTGSANSVVTINIMDMQTLANSLNSTVQKLTTVADALNQGTAINNQVLGNTATTLDYVQSLHTKVNSIISSLETAGASVSVDLSPIQLVLSDINSLVTEVASASAVLPGLSSNVDAIQAELTNLASMTVVLGDIAVNVSSVSNQLTDVASSVSMIGGIESTLLSIQNQLTDVVGSGLSSISERITELSSSTFMLPSIAVEVGDISSQVSSIESELTELASSSAIWLSIYNQISSLSDSVTAVEGVGWSLPAVSSKVDAIDSTMGVVLGHTTGIDTIRDQITNNASQSLAIWSEVQSINTKVSELETQLSAVQEAIDLGTIEGLLTEEFGKSEAMRENYEKPLITDIMEDIGYSPVGVGALPDTNIWKKLFWFDIPSITASAEALKLTASQRFPFSIFTVVSGLNVSITDETVAMPFVIDLGVNGRYEMDWLNSDLANSFKGVFKPISTLFIWSYFIGFVIKLMPKVRID
jgi:hypothetical protein